MPQGLVVHGNLFRRIKALAEVYVEFVWFERKQGVDDLTVVGANTNVLCSGFLEPCSVRKQLVLDGGGPGFVYPHMQVERARWSRSLSIRCLILGCSSSSLGHGFKPGHSSAAWSFFEVPAACEIVPIQAMFFEDLIELPHS